MKENIEEDFFGTVDAWNVYSRIIACNYLSHREIYTDVAQVLRKLNDDFSLLDLGCGDAVCLAPVLATLPVKSYYGVDISPAALDLAKKNLKTLPCTVELRNIDLLQALRDTNRQYRVIFSSFAIHHLSISKKTELFQLTMKRLSKGGIFLLIDAMREEGEDLPAYINAYCYQIRNKWQTLNTEEREFACHHVIENDFAETVSTLETMAIRAGFASCQKVSKYPLHQVLCFETN